MRDGPENRYAYDVIKSFSPTVMHYVQNTERKRLRIQQNLTQNLSLLIPRVLVLVCSAGLSQQLGQGSPLFIYFVLLFHPPCAKI